MECLEQHMPSGMKWHEFLRNAGNKEQLFDLIDTNTQEQKQVYSYD